MPTTASVLVWTGTVDVDTDSPTLLGSYGGDQMAREAVEEALHASRTMPSGWRWLARDGDTQQYQQTTDHVTWTVVGQIMREALTLTASDPSVIVSEAPA